MGRQDAQNIRGHFNKVQRCRTHSSFDSCLATLCYLLLIYINFNILILLPSSHPGFTPNRVFIFSHWGCLFTTDFLETTEFCWEEHRTRGLSKDILEWAVCSFQPQFCVTLCTLSGCFSTSTSHDCYLSSASSEPLSACHEDMSCTDSVS